MKKRQSWLTLPQNLNEPRCCFLFESICGMFEHCKNMKNGSDVNCKNKTANLHASFQVYRVSLSQSKFISKFDDKEMNKPG